MILLLMRHAEAEEPGSQPGVDTDRLRALTEKGKGQCVAMARLLGNVALRPTHLLTSPRLRCVETTEAIRAELSLHARVQLVDSLDFGGTWEAFLGDLAPCASSRNPPCVLAVGHQPWIGQFVLRALADLHTRDLAVKKAACIALRWEQAVGSGTAELIFAASPSIARRLGMRDE